MPVICFIIVQSLSQGSPSIFGWYDCYFFSFLFGPRVCLVTVLLVGNCISCIVSKLFNFRKSPLSFYPWFSVKNTYLRYSFVILLHLFHAIIYLHYFEM